MTGYVAFEPNRGENGRYVVWFYNPESKRTEPIRRNTNGDFLYEKKMAERLLSIIQGDYERRNVVPFKLSKYKGTGGISVLKYINHYIEHGMKHMKPGGKNSALSRLRNWVIPFFKPRNILLHEITTCTLVDLANFPPLKFKTRENVLSDFKAVLDFAATNGKIPFCPEMPERRYYKKDTDIVPDDEVVRNHSSI